MRVADFIAGFLVANDVTDVFSVVGGGAMFLNDALGHNDGLHVTYNHHEQACAMAAEGYVRSSQRMAAVCVTTGPGGTNAITGVLGSWVDSVPMLVISGQVKYSTTVFSTDVPLRQLGDQEWRITDTVREMTKYAVMVTEPNQIAYHLEKAIWLASNGRPGPCWIDIPLNVQSSEIDPKELEHFDFHAEGTSCLLAQERCTPVADDLIVELTKRIEGAKRPVILAGGGIRTAKSFSAFREFVENIGIPVCTAWNAHDLIDDNHPLYAGRPGTIGTRGGNFVVQTADLVISLACRMNIRQISYNWENFAKNAYLVAVDIDEAELEKPTLQVDLPIHADISDFLSTANRVGFNLPIGHHSDWICWCREINKKYPPVLKSYWERETPVNPYVFMEALSLKLSNDDVIVASNGAACVCSFQAMHIQRGQRLFTNSGMASMGYGLPAALGAAVSRSGKRTVCLEGDGSLMMNIQELQTVSYSGLNLKLFVLNNDGYHSIRQTQTNSFAGNFCGINSASGVGFPDWEKVASAFDLPYMCIDSLSALEKNIEICLGYDGPILCEVVVGSEQFFEPKLSSRRLPDGSIVSPTLEDMSPFLSEDEKRSVAFGGGVE